MRDIVVGIDGSAAADRVLDRAIAQAQANGAELRVVHAWRSPVWIAAAPTMVYAPVLRPDDSKRFAEELVEEVVAKALSRRQSDAPLRLATSALQGETGHVLVEAAKEAGLLVLGSRGQGELKSALLASPTRYSLHHARCPVMLVPEEGAPICHVQHVIVGVDGSAASRSAMRWALDAAAQHGCPLVAMHAWLLTSLPGRPPMHYVPSLREYEAEVQEWLDQEIADVLPDRRGVDLRTELSHGTASWSLLDKAGPDDLLVVGSRGRGGFASLLLGSVATQCAQHARGVAVVVRAGEERLD